MKINLVVLDDHFLHLELIRNVLGQHDNINMLKTYTNIIDLYNALPQLVNNIDIFLLDIYITDGNGLDLAIYIKNKYPNKKVVLLSGVQNIYYIGIAKQVGIDGYLYKTISTDILMQYLLRIMSQEIIFMECPTRLNQSDDERRFLTKLQSLSEDKIRLIQDIASGLTYQEIAEKHFKSARTIEGKVSALVVYFGSKNRTEMINTVMKYLQ